MFTSKELTSYSDDNRSFEERGVEDNTILDGLFVKRVKDTIVNREAYEQNPCWEY
jgi:hypothetical protein